MPSPPQDRRFRIAGALVGLLALLFLFMPVVPFRETRPPGDGGATDGPIRNDRPSVAVAPPEGEPTEASLRGQVTLPSGEPAKFARVRVVGSGILGFLEVGTDERGVFELRSLPAGFYEVQAFLGTYVSHGKSGIQVRPDETATIELAMVPGVAIDGRVVSARTGEGIPGAEVRISGEFLDIAPRVVETANDGSFVAPGLTPGPKVVRVHKEGFVHEAPFQMSPEEGEVLIRLGTEARLALEIVDPRGRPVSDAEAQLLVEGKLDEGDLPIARDRLLVIPGPVAPIPVGGAAPDARKSILASGSSDDDGRLHLDGLLAGVVRIRLSAEGRPTVIGEPVELRPGRTTRAQMTLPYGGTLSVRVFDAHGVRAEHADLSIRLEGDPIGAYARTDENGEAEIAGLLGSLEVRASRGTSPPTVQQVDIAEGEHRTLSVTLGEAEDELSGRVVDARGFGIAGAGVELATLSKRSPFTAFARAEADGTFRFGALPAPPYQVIVRHPAYADSDPVRVESRGEPLNVVLDPGGTVVGEVRDRRTLEPVAAALSLTRGARRIPARVWSDGRFEVEHIPLGRWTLRIDDPGYVPFETEVELSGGGSRPPKVDLGRVDLVPGASVTGELVDSVGDPIYGARITSGQQAETKSDEGGRFSLARIAPGRATVRATLDSGEVVESAPFVLREGELREGVRLTARSRGEEVDVPEAPSARMGIPITVVDAAGGVEIEWVAPESSARRKGLRPGDRVLAIDGQAVIIAAQARPMLRGARRTLRVARGGRTRDVTVTAEHFTPP